MFKHKFRTVTLCLLFSLTAFAGTVYAHEHVPHACPKNKRNPQASCPGHKPPKDDNTTSLSGGGFDTIGCGCTSIKDITACFFGY